MSPFMLLTAQVVFWVSLYAIAYAYVIYPALIFVCSRLFGNKPVPPASVTGETPSVSLLIAALNEEQVIEERLENALQLDYPAEKLEIVIASDGSVDRTTEMIRRYQQNFPGRIKLLDYAQRRGKATVLNVSMPELTGEIVLFSDANTYFDATAARNVVRWFADPRVGVVCGKLKLVNPRSGKNVDSLYWRFETFIKECEGRLGALLGSNGAIYAIRRADYIPIAGDTIIDDFMIPLLVKMRGGKRIIYDIEAVAHEETPSDMKSEFGRRSRIGAGGFQSLMRLWQLLLPVYGWTTFAFWSHKLIRWCCPAFMVLALLTNGLLAGNAFYGAIFALQLAFYSFALVGNFVTGNTRPVRVMRLTTMFTSMNLALAVGFWRWISGLQKGTWQRTIREPAEVAS